MPYEYEYKVGSCRPEELEEHLNSWAKDGWRLAALSYHAINGPGSHFILTLERKLP